MSNRLISEEDVTKMSANPNVESVSQRLIVFTPEFKERAYEELRAGKRIQEILIDAGIDPLILGKARVNGLREKIEIAAKRPEGFANLRKTKIPQSKEIKEESLQKQIKTLRQELAYTRQEVEFLKKIRMADLEARNEWELKHRQK